MIRRYCDACAKETTRLIPIEIPCHLWQFRGSVNGYVDMDMNRVSGKSNTLDLCTPCSNLVYDAAVREILEIKERNDHE